MVCVNTGSALACFLNTVTHQKLHLSLCTPHLLLLCIFLEAQPGLDLAEAQVVWRDVQWREEVCLRLAMADTATAFHIPCMHVAGDGGNLWLQGIWWGSRGEREEGRGI